MPLTASTGGMDWSLAIADPTAAGWLIVVAYGVAEYFCVLNYRRRKTLIDQPRQRRLGVYWLALSLGMLFMGFNKQLDLQALVLEVAHELAREDGWLGLNRGLKLALLAGLMLLTLVALAWFIALMKTLGDRVLISAIGFSVLITYVLLRAVVFYVDQMEGIDVRAPGVVMGRVFESAGIALIIGGAWRNLRRAKSVDSHTSHTTA